MSYEAAKEIFLDRLALADGRLTKEGLRAQPYRNQLLEDLVKQGVLVQEGGAYLAAGVLAEGLEARKAEAQEREKVAKARQEAERIEAERKKAYAARLAAEQEAARKKAAALADQHYQAFRAKREKVLTLSGLVKALGISKTVLERGLAELSISSCVDGKGREWFDVREVEALREELSSFTSVDTGLLAAFFGVTRGTVLKRLRKLGVEPWSRGNWNRSSLYLWRDVRVLFPDPKPELSAFQACSKEKKEVAKRAKEAKEAQREAERAQARWEKAERDRAQVTAMFPIVARAAWPRLIISVGSTNSGKTHAALEALAAAPSGVYLAPLRLLAWEVYERLNARGVPCDLVTGEEVIRTPNARHQAATVEMFQPNEEEIIVLDEAQMAADSERGGAWTRVLTHAQAKVLHLCCASEARALLQRFVSVLGYPTPIVQEHQRLCPLELHETLFPIEKPTESCIYIVFSRIDALVLKSYFEEEKGIPTSVLYGALPPDVRRAQAERFLRGGTRVCVATDALGLGMNLPARYVAFTTLSKFDGKQRRLLTAAEVQQIAGRAGRFGLHEVGLVGACSTEVQQDLHRLFSAKAQEPTTLRITPTLQELELLSGSLASRLAYWAELRAIPPVFQSLLSPCDVRPLIELADQIHPTIERDLDLARCFAFVQAPVSRESAAYWVACVESFVFHDEIPPPEDPPTAKKTREASRQLLELEKAVRERELFLWLANRPFFAHAAAPADVREMTRQKHALSQQMDHLLCRAKLQQKKQCKGCGKALPPLAWKRYCGGCDGDEMPFGW